MFKFSWRKRHVRLIIGIFIACVATPAAADPQLGDLIFYLPQIFLYSLYMVARDSYLWLLLGAALSWAWFWRFDDDFENIIPLWLMRRRGGPSLKLSLTILSWLACITVLIGVSIVDFEVRQKITRPDAVAPQKSATPEPPKPPPKQYRNPMGGTWPAQSGLIGGSFAPEPDSGSLVIDNSAGQAGVYLKLCHIGSRACPGLRHYYVAEGDQFTANGLASGYFEVRYVETRASDSVRWAKSEAFEIETGRTIEIKLPARPGNGIVAQSVIAISSIRREAFR